MRANSGAAIAARLRRAPRREREARARVAVRRDDVDVLRGWVREEEVGGEVPEEEGLLDVFLAKVGACWLVGGGRREDGQWI